MRVLSHWPGSFRRLIWLGFFCVSFPLVAALVNAGVFAGRLARDSGQAVARAARAAGDSRLLLDQVISLERRARQLYVLGESQFLGDYAERRVAMRETARRLQELLGEGEQADRLARMLALEEEIHRVLSGGPHEKGVDQEALNRFLDLNGLAREVMGESTRLALAEADALQRAAGRAQRLLFLEAAGLIPLTFFLAAVFASLLTKPIRQIIRAIRRLGAGDFQSTVAVRGPRDLEFLGQRLDWLRRRLAELEAEKAKFLAHVSHELKTPLTAIREGVELIREEVVGTLSPEQREVTGIIRESTIRLQRLIENLLQFSVGRAKGAIRLTGTTDLTAVVRGVLADHKPAVLAKSIAVRSDGEDEAWVTGQKDRLRTVVDNLVSNAVKFTPSGGEVRLSVRRGEGEVVLEVCDTGPGISVEERARVLEPFFQGAARGHGPVKGSGLGLSIVQEYVSELGGRLEMEEGPEGGALVRIALPEASRRDAA